MKFYKPGNINNRSLNNIKWSCILSNMVSERGHTCHEILQMERFYMPLNIYPTLPPQVRLILKAKEPPGGRTGGFMSFPRALILSEIQTASSRI